jgi:hypothetical protein
MALIAQEFDQVPPIGDRWTYLCLNAFTIGGIKEARQKLAIANSRDFIHIEMMVEGRHGP